MAKKTQPKKKPARKKAPAKRKKATKRKRTPRPRTPGGGRVERYKPEQVIEALRNSAGVYLHAATMLGCARNTIRGYVERYPEIAEALDEILEENIDLGETALLGMMGDPAHRGHSSSVQFYLRTKGKRRGYVDKKEHEHSGPDGKALVFYIPQEEP